MSAKELSEVVRRLKVKPPDKLAAEGRAAMVRFSEEQALAEKKRITERRHRLDPVYKELAAVLRKSPELAGVVRAIDMVEKHRPRELPAARKSRLAPAKPLARLARFTSWTHCRSFPIRGSGRTAPATTSS